ncbi:hypothetical protein WME90_44415 [Sorangium sp. So ce375]|uniref:hypothetical protein n=1 Tax=Sorangium sp. So ce375 TaxID=3133306 RepID=UPI003F5B1EA8
MVDVGGETDETRAEPLARFAHLRLLDPDDRDELRRRIAALPPAEMSLMKRTIMNVKAMNWLRGK